MTVSISVASVVSVENVYGMARGVMHTVNSVVSTTVSATVSISVSTVCDVSYDTGVDCKVVTMMGANDWVFVIVGDSTKNVSDMVSAAVSTTVSYSNCMVATTAKTQRHSLLIRLMGGREVQMKSQMLVFGNLRSVIHVMSNFRLTRTSYYSAGSTLAQFRSFQCWQLLSCLCNRLFYPHPFLPDSLIYISICFAKALEERLII